MQRSPVCTATPPDVSTIATCRTSTCSSTDASECSASCAESPLCMSAMPRAPYAGSTNDCVATAPTPDSAQPTSPPTENQCDCTATPNCPVFGSRATIE